MTAVAKGYRKDILDSWDKSSKNDRKQLLSDFLNAHMFVTGPELEKSLDHTAPLLFARLTASLRMTYLSVPDSLFEQIAAVEVFIKAAGGLNFVEQFVDVGGPIALLDIIALKQVPSHCKTQALQTLISLAESGLRYKCILCESNCIKVVTECLARTDDEDTRVTARELLLQIGLVPPSKKWCSQIYIAFIALLASRSPRANHLAVGGLRRLQPLLGEVLPGIVDPLINLLGTLHLEVLLEACQLIKQLVDFEKTSDGVRNSIFQSLILKLKLGHTNEGTFTPDLISQLNDADEDGPPIPALVAQAGAARCIAMLITNSPKNAKELLKLDVISWLLCSAGQYKYYESRRMSFFSVANLLQRLQDGG